MYKIFVIVVALVLLAGGIVVYAYYGTGADPFTLQTNTNENSSESVDRVMDIETYVRLNISQLSTQPEVLGGTFYVTSINAANGRGVVEYEDGHNAFTANFTYTLDSETGITIHSFTIRN